MLIKSFNEKVENRSSFTKVNGVKYTIGATILFISYYSIYYKPMKNFYFKIKNAVRNITTSFYNCPSVIMYILKPTQHKLC